MHEAYQKNLEEFEETEAKFYISTLNCIHSKLHLVDLPVGWVIYQPNSATILFLKIQLYNEISTIEGSIIINEKSYCKAFDKETNKVQLSCHSLTDIRSLENIIHEVESFEIYKNENVISSSTPWIQQVNNAIHNITNAINTLNPTSSMSDFEPENNSLKIRLNFLLDQLKYLIVDKHARRYSILTQVFCLKIHGISPACYRLIQASNCVILPHERKLLNLKNSIGLESEYTKILAEVASTFNDLKRDVILQMDEVHIRSDANYKRGRVFGSIDNQDDPHTTVFSMMVSSLSTKYSSIVRLIPLGSSSAETLYPIGKSTICDIEACGVFVEAVCTDNYPLNVRLYQCFSSDSKLRPNVQHPCNPQRNLILFFDIVHIISSIRNNWVNLKNFDNTFIFPRFDDCQLSAQQNISDKNKGFYVSILRANNSTISLTSKSIFIPNFATHHLKISVICLNLINVMS